MKLQGVLNRIYMKHMVDINSVENSTLSLLVESQGRINFGSRLHDRKGILSPILFNGKSLQGSWTITGYPLDNVESKNMADYEGTSDLSDGQVLYEGEFVLADGQGYVWVNGHNLGRYWPGLGPQVTLYVPGIWLNAAPAHNRVQILELEKVPAKLTMEFIDYPILNRTQPVVYSAT
ncbi:hypothetical protein ACJJTC_018712 [Scirpophaga incertulas]